MAAMISVPPVELLAESTKPRPIPQSTAPTRIDMVASAMNGSVMYVSVILSMTVRPIVLKSEL